MLPIEVQAKERVVRMIGASLIVETGSWGIGESAGLSGGESGFGSGSQEPGGVIVIVPARTDASGASSKKVDGIVRPSSPSSPAENPTRREGRERPELADPWLVR